MIHFDTAFFIDLADEVARERPGGAFELIESLDEREILTVSVHVVCELRVGAELGRNALKEQERVDDMLHGFHVVYPNDRFAPLFGRLRAEVIRNNRTVNDLDLLIATAALLDDAPVVTRNVKDFSRVPGLRVLGY